MYLFSQLKKRSLSQVNLTTRHFNCGAVLPLFCRQIFNSRLRFG